MKIERTRIHFFSDVFSVVAVLGSYGPYFRLLRLPIHKRSVMEGLEGMLNRITDGNLVYRVTQ